MYFLNLYFKGIEKLFNLEEISYIINYPYSYFTFQAAEINFIVYACFFCCCCGGQGVPDNTYEISQPLEVTPTVPTT